MSNKMERAMVLFIQLYSRYKKCQKIYISAKISYNNKYRLMTMKMEQFNIHKIISTWWVVFHLRSINLRDRADGASMEQRCGNGSQSFDISSISSAGSNYVKTTSGRTPIKRTNVLRYTFSCSFELHGGP